MYSIYPAYLSTSDSSIFVAIEVHQNSIKIFVNDNTEMQTILKHQISRVDQHLNNLSIKTQNELFVFLSNYAYNIAECIKHCLINKQIPKKNYFQVECVIKTPFQLSVIATITQNSVIIDIKNEKYVIFYQNITSCSHIVNNEIIIDYEDLNKQTTISIVIQNEDLLKIILHMVKKQKYIKSIQTRDERTIQMNAQSRYSQRISTLQRDNKMDLVQTNIEQNARDNFVSDSYYNNQSETNNIQQLDVFLNKFNQNIKQSYFDFLSELRKQMHLDVSQQISNSQLQSMQLSNSNQQYIQEQNHQDTIQTQSNFKSHDIIDQSIENRENKPNQSNMATKTKRKHKSSINLKDDEKQIHIEYQALIQNQKDMLDQSYKQLQQEQKERQEIQNQVLQFQQLILQQEQNKETASGDIQQLKQQLQQIDLLKVQLNDINLQMVEKNEQLNQIQQELTASQKIKIENLVEVPNERLNQFQQLAVQQQQEMAQQKLQIQQLQELIINTTSQLQNNLQQQIGEANNDQLIKQHQEQQKLQNQQFQSQIQEQIQVQQKQLSSSYEQQLLAQQQQFQNTLNQKTAEYQQLLNQLQEKDDQHKSQQINSNDQCNQLLEMQQQMQNYQKQQDQITTQISEQKLNINAQMQNENNYKQKENKNDHPIFNVVQQQNDKNLNVQQYNDQQSLQQVDHQKLTSQECDQQNNNNLQQSESQSDISSDTEAYQTNQENVYQINEQNLSQDVSDVSEQKYHQQFDNQKIQTQNDNQVIQEQTVNIEQQRYNHEQEEVNQYKHQQNEELQEQSSSQKEVNQEEPQNNTDNQQYQQENVQYINTVEQQINQDIQNTNEQDQILENNLNVSIENEIQEQNQFQIDSQTKQQFEEQQIHKDNEQISLDKQNQQQNEIQQKELTLSQLKIENKISMSQSTIKKSLIKMQDQKISSIRNQLFEQKSDLMDQLDNSIYNDATKYYNYQDNLQVFDQQKSDFDIISFFNQQSFSIFDVLKMKRRVINLNYDIKSNQLNILDQRGCMGPKTELSVMKNIKKVNFYHSLPSSYFIKHFSNQINSIITQAKLYQRQVSDQLQFKVIAPQQIEIPNLDVISDKNRKKCKILMASIYDIDLIAEKHKNQVYYYEFIGNDVKNKQQTWVFMTDDKVLMQRLNVLINFIINNYGSNKNATKQKQQKNTLNNDIEQQLPIQQYEYQQNAQLTCQNEEQPQIKQDQQLEQQVTEQIIDKQNNVEQHQSEYDYDFKQILSENEINKNEVFEYLNTKVSQCVNLTSQNQKYFKFQLIDNQLHFQLSDSEEFDNDKKNVLKNICQISFYHDIGKTCSLDYYKEQLGQQTISNLQQKYKFIIKDVNQQTTDYVQQFNKKQLKQYQKDIEYINEIDELLCQENIRQNTFFYEIVGMNYQKKQCKQTIMIYNTELAKEINYILRFVEYCMNQDQ